MSASKIHNPLPLLRKVLLLGVDTALREVWKTVLMMTSHVESGKLPKAVGKLQSHLCVLAPNCDEPMYVKLVVALCSEHQNSLIKVDDRKRLGEWVGLYKTDREGKPLTVVGCCCVVKDYETKITGRACY